ncbi:hypothetical protein A9Q81_14635 [Gammaproteobacteria bacterium 42_54_T18]|nr:hypothetical protein A9Q81_14635 [Gammaproteobacteria bacterium 42_54_T18]
MTSSKHHQSPTANIEQELLRMLALQGWMGTIPTVLLLSVIASFASEYFHPIYWATWLIVASTFLFSRAALLIQLPKLTQYSERFRINIVVCGSIISGSLHAFSFIFFFPEFSDYQRAIHSMIIMGIGAVTIMTTAGFLPISLAYIIPAGLSSSSMWVITTLQDNGEPIGYIVAVMLCVSNITMLILSKESFGLIRGFFSIRNQQEELNHQLQEALKTAESASRAKTRFLASASHDLRQPIHALSLFSGALSRRTLDKESREIAEHMDTALQSLVSHLDSLLDISKLDAGIVQANVTPFNLRLMGERLQSEFIPSASEKNLKLWFDCVDDAYVESDEFLLDRILRNLIANAIKYTHSGNVELSIENLEHTHRIRISDTGQGIPQSEQTRIFEEFYQLDNPERDNTQGLGLGLAIVNRLVSLLDIDIHLESSISTGTCFTLTLAKSHKIPTPNNILPPSQFSWENISALVIDDDHEVGLGMKVLLEGLGCHVLLADGTESAIHMVRSTRPDIILADFRLRGKDNGILSIHSIHKLYPALPAILISGDTAPERLLEAKQANIQMLHKPVLVDELEQAIATLFKHKDIHQEACLEV